MYCYLRPCRFFNIIPPGDLQFMLLTDGENVREIVAKTNCISAVCMGHIQAHHGLMVQPQFLKGCEFDLHQCV